MTEEEAFLTALQANPADDVTRLVYADWLDEHNEAVKAEYLRLVVQLKDACELLTPGSAEVAQLQQLATATPSDWREAAADRFMLVLYGYDASTKILVIKSLRELTDFGLAESKAMSEVLPAKVWSKTTLERVSGGHAVLSKIPAVTARIHPFELEQLPAVVKYQLVARWMVWRGGQRQRTEAVTAFIDYLTRVLGMDMPRAAELAEQSEVVIGSDLEPAVASQRASHYRRHLPTPGPRSGWSIWLEARPIPVVHPST